MRRYCIDKHRHWGDIYATLRHQGQTGDGDWYSTKALDTFPRYNILNAIRVAVESIDSECLADFAAAKSLLINAGSMADDDFTRNRVSEIAANAQTAERVKFSDFVSSVSELDVWEYELLPYRRVLTIAESDNVWASLESAWGIMARSYWYPLCETSVADIVAFRADDFHKFLPSHALRRKLADLSVDRVWELREYGPEYIEDFELFEPCYNGAEGTWTAPGHAWVIYASHESSVTVAGTLLPEIKRMWPNWQQYEW